MKRNLNDLLRETDRVSPAQPKAVGNLAAVVRQTISRRRRRRQFVGVTSVVTAALAVAMYVVSVDPEPQEVATSKPPPSRETMLATSNVSEPSVDQRIQEQTAELLLQRLASQPHRVRPRSATSIGQVQRDQAALVLIYDGDQYAKANRPDEAIAVYRRAVELFPQSRWADVAREKIKEYTS